MAVRFLGVFIFLFCTNFISGQTYRDSYQNPEEIISCSINEHDLLSNTILETKNNLQKFINLKELIIYSGLFPVPSWIGELKSLEHLYIIGESVPEISDSLRSLENLKTLVITNPGESKFPSFISYLDNLEILHIGLNNLDFLPPTIDHKFKKPRRCVVGFPLVELPNSIGRLKKLKLLSITECSLKSIPDSIGHCEMLETIKLNTNKITNIPKSIGNLKQLVTLDLWNNRIELIPYEIGSAEKLTNLRIHANRIVEMPKDIVQLKNLKPVDLSGNLLLKKDLLHIPNHETLFENVHPVTSFNSIEVALLKPEVVERLYIDDDELKEIPSSIGELINLKKLTINGDEIKKLPQSIGKLINLTHFEIIGTKIQKLPESVGNLIDLVILNLSKNNLSRLPQSAEKLTKVAKLNLSNNKLTKFPETISKMSNLTDLRLDNNAIESVPDFLGNFKKLKRLSLTGNKLTKFAIPTTNLQQLNQLHLTNNLLQDINLDFTNLVRLNDLYLANNKIESISETIEAAKNLSLLFLKQNQLDSIPGFICDMARVKLVTDDIPCERAIDISVDEIDDDKIYYKGVEESPRFLGCEHIVDLQSRQMCANKEMLTFIYRNLKYPPEAKKQDIEGTVVVSFIIEKNGSISKATVRKNIDDEGLCGEEARRVINLMNAEGVKWIPGKQASQNVRVGMNVPIKFRIR